MDIRTVSKPVEQQVAITLDNVSITVDAVIIYKIVEPEKAFLAVENVRVAIDQVAQTNLRIILGKHSLDDTLRNQDTIAKEMLEKIAAVTSEWGVKVERVEMRNITIPETMQRAMAQEAEATREKRARITRAEGEADAAQKLADAAKTIEQFPAALELRRMEMLTAMGTEQNSTIVVMIPAEFSQAAAAFSRMAHSPGTSTHPD